MRKMNHILFRLKKLLILSALMLGTLVQAQDHTDKRSVRRSFPATIGTTLEIQNKYGKIQMATWDKDSVAIEVDILLTESSSSKLKTLIESERGRLASELKSIGNAISGSNKRIEINYTVHLPVHMDVVLNNKFG